MCIALAFRYIYSLLAWQHQLWVMEGVRRGICGMVQRIDAIVHHLKNGMSTRTTAMCSGLHQEGKKEHEKRTGIVMSIHIRDQGVIRDWYCTWVGWNGSWLMFYVHDLTTRNEWNLQYAIALWNFLARRRFLDVAKLTLAKVSGLVFAALLRRECILIYRNNVTHPPGVVTVARRSPLTQTQYERDVNLEPYCPFPIWPMAIGPITQVSTALPKYQSIRSGYCFEHEDHVRR